MHREPTVAILLPPLRLSDAREQGTNDVGSLHPYNPLDKHDSGNIIVAALHCRTSVPLRCSTPTPLSLRQVLASQGQRKYGKRGDPTNN